MKAVLKSRVIFAYWFKAEEQAWVEDPPERVQYTSLYADTSEEEESASTST